MPPPPSYQHYIWASGHFLLLLASLRYVFAVLTLKAASAFWYKASYIGALISYAIVCNRSPGLPQPNLGYFRRAMLDENVQYFLLAIVWFTSKPITVTLLPYMVFSLFHALTFTRTTLISQFLPPGPPNSSGTPGPHPLAKRFQVWIKANYDSAMRIVAFTELVIFVRIFLGAITFQNALLPPIIYAHFLRQRYHQSAFTRDAVGVSAGYVDAWVKKPGNPPMAVMVWERGKEAVRRWGGVVIVQNEDQQQQQQ